MDIKSCDASCVICTRDIHDLSLEKENELREKLREAGSPMDRYVASEKMI